MQAVTKITTKGVMGGKPNLKKLLAWDNENPGKVMWLYTVLGICNKAKPDSHIMPNGDVSDYVKFSGTFQATNIETGEVYRSGAAILPKTAQELLYGVLSDGQTTGVQLGFKIGLKFDASSAVQYVYVVESLMETSQNDPIKLLEAQIVNQNLRLAAPVTNEQQTQDINAAEQARSKGKKAA